MANIPKKANSFNFIPVQTSHGAHMHEVINPVKLAEIRNIYI